MEAFSFFTTQPNQHQIQEKGREMNSRPFLLPAILYYNLIRLFFRSTSAMRWLGSISAIEISAIFRSVSTT